MSSLVTALGQELERLLEPLIVAAGSSERWPLVLALVGHTADVASNPGLRAALDNLGALANLGDVDVETWDGIEAILGAASRATHALHEIEHAADDPALGERLKQLGPELTEQLTAVYLRRFHTRLFRLAAILGVVDPSSRTTPSQHSSRVACACVQHGRRTSCTSIAASPLLRDPWTVLRAIYRTICGLPPMPTPLPIVSSRCCARRSTSWGWHRASSDAPGCLTSRATRAAMAITSMIQNLPPRTSRRFRQLATSDPITARPNRA